MNQSRNMKLIIAVSSILTTILLFIAFIKENVAVRWKEYQQMYRIELIARAKTDAQRKAADIDIKLRQEYLADLGRIDRCTSCHIGIEDPLMAATQQPLRAHSGNALKHHPLSKFGCTICHDGQGLATETAAAHGQTPYWPEPLLCGDLVYTSCGRCHYDNDLYGAENDLFTIDEKSHLPLMQEELDSAVMGGEAIALGKQLVLSSGCLGCHKYRRRGGILGPDITYIGDKKKHDFDLSHLEGTPSVERWLFEHFKNPDKLSPGTLMPDANLRDSQARALARYMLSLHRKSMPASHTPVPPRQRGNPASGRQLYTMFCCACHGSHGQGSTVRDPLLAAAADVPPELMVPSLSNPDTLAVASDDYLAYIIKNGRPDTSMIAWGDFNKGGLQLEEIIRIVDYVKTWQPPAPDTAATASMHGNASMGQILYARNCAACHGPRGEGGIGPSLNAPSFLAIASDEFLARALIEGRPNTAMPSWKQFETQQVNDIVAFMRGWHLVRNTKKKTLGKTAQHAASANFSASIGRTLYNANCVMCHGLTGEGDLAPSLASQEFLSIIDNAYLYDTISLGRPGTGMPAWRHFSDDDMASLLLYLRGWQKQPYRPLSPDPIQGDWDNGERLFKGMCASCHGEHAEGAVGPQLNNPIFLQTSTDAVIQEWIANGRAGTQMRSFRKGRQGMVALSNNQIQDVVSFVRSLERRPRVSVMRSPNGRPELGRLWYNVMCLSCHGANGEGASGPSLSNIGFLRAASDGYLMATMALGRDGTEMRPVKKSPQSILSLSSDQVNDLVAYVRSWETNPVLHIPHSFIIPWDLTKGKMLFEANCSGCHGVNGKAELIEPGMSAWAPALHNEGFLAAATDGFLMATIVRGRRGTAMVPFGQGMQGMVDLSGNEIENLVAFIRQWSTRAAHPMTIPAEYTRIAIQNVGR